MTETWKPVVGHEGAYEVSDLGRVRSLPGGHRHGKILKMQPGSKTPHLSLILVRDGRSIRRRVHQLVAEAFIGPRPTGLEVRHLNGVADDNRPENLAYGTHAENMADIMRHGGNAQSKRAECSKGHPFDEGNTILRVVKATGRTRRVCRACELANGYVSNARVAARRAARRALLASPVVA